MYWEHDCFRWQSHSTTIFSSPFVIQHYLSIYTQVDCKYVDLGEKYNNLEIQKTENTC